MQYLQQSPMHLPVHAQIEMQPNQALSQNVLMPPLSAQHGDGQPQQHAKQPQRHSLQRQAEHQYQSAQQYQRQQQQYQQQNHQKGLVRHQHQQSHQLPLHRPAESVHAETACMPIANPNAWSAHEVLLFDDALAKLFHLNSKMPLIDLAKCISKRMGGLRSLGQCYQRIASLQAYSRMPSLPQGHAVLSHVQAHALPSSLPLSQQQIEAEKRMSFAQRKRAQLAKEVRGWAALKAQADQQQAQQLQQQDQPDPVSGTHHPSHDAHRCWQLDDVTATASRAVVASEAAKNMSKAAAVLSASMQIGSQATKIPATAPSILASPGGRTAIPVAKRSSFPAVDALPSARPFGKQLSALLVPPAHSSTYLRISPDWQTLTMKAHCLYDLWVHPPNARQVETNILHLCRAVVREPQTSQQNLSSWAQMAPHKISLYLRGQFMGNQEAVEYALLSFLKRYTDGEFDGPIESMEAMPNPRATSARQGPPSTGIWTASIVPLPPGHTARLKAKEATFKAASGRDHAIRERTHTAFAAIAPRATAQTADAPASDAAVETAKHAASTKTGQITAKSASQTAAQIASCQLPSAGAIASSNILAPVLTNTPGSCSAVASCPVVVLDVASDSVDITPDTSRSPISEEPSPRTPPPAVLRQTVANSPAHWAPSGSKRRRSGEIARRSEANPQTLSSAEVIEVGIVRHGEWTDAEDQRLLAALQMFTTGRTKLKNKRTNMRAVAKHVGTRSVKQVRIRITRQLRTLQRSNNARARNSSNRRAIREARARAAADKELGDASE
jgi:hypothetical protein